MNAMDMIFGFVLLIFIFIGIWKGFFREVLGFTGIVAGIIFGVLGFDKAIVTSGGIFLKEIDSKTMKSKIIENLFFAGEIIDLDGPSGGYNLQLCWTTGYVAGQSAASGVV